MPHIDHKGPENLGPKTGRKLGKNVVAVGFLDKLLNLKPEPFLQVLKIVFGISNMPSLSM